MKKRGFTLIELLVVIAILMVTANVGSLPAENCLVARYSPSHRRGLFYGLKFVFAIGVASGLGVKLEGALFDASGDFFWLFVVLASLAAAASAIGFLLPGEPSKQPARPLPDKVRQELAATRRHGRLRAGVQAMPAVTALQKWLGIEEG